MSGRLMVRELSKETKAEVFWPFEKKRGLILEGKIHVDGKRERGRPRMQWEWDKVLRCNPNNINDYKYGVKKVAILLGP